MSEQEQRANEMQLIMEQAVQHLEAQYAGLEPPSTRALPAIEEMLPMTDGVSLRTVIQRPAGDGPFPTIIQRSCYPHIESIHKAHAQAYAQRGFAFVYQFCRGTGGSEGIWEPNVNDRSDGKVTLDWLDAQPWTGSIGFLGSSYLAFTGWITADILPPKVRTLYLTHYGTDRFVSAYQRGLFRVDVLTAWAMENAGKPIDADFMESAAYCPQITVDENLWKVGELSWYRDWITNTNRDDEYWKSGFWKMLKDIPGKIKVPLYLGASWYDHHLGSALQTWQDLSEETRTGSTLRIGAWNHMFMPCLEGQKTENLENSDTKTAFDWFCAYLRDKKPLKNGVLAYQIGADVWREEPVYPFETGSAYRMYFSNKRGEEGYMLLKEPAQEGHISYTYNPENPVPTHGAESVLRHIEEAGSRLQFPCGYREDVISFMGEPMKESLEILGEIEVALYVSSDAEDTSFNAKVMEVFPDGRAYNIRSSIATLAYPNEKAVQRGTYKAGEVVQITIKMWDIFWKTRVGSKLRVDISSSDFPEYVAHTNNPGIWALQTSAKKAHQKLHFGQKYTAHVKIPLMKKTSTCQ
jgi:putative hydrolase, CocE/NonD family